MGKRIETDIEVAMRDWDGPYRLSGSDAEVFLREDGTLVVVDYDARARGMSGEVFFAAAGDWTWASVHPRPEVRIATDEELAVRLAAYDAQRLSFGRTITNQGQ